LADAASVPLGCEGWERGISALAQARFDRRSGDRDRTWSSPINDRIGEAVLASWTRRRCAGCAPASRTPWNKWGRERTDMLAR